MSPSPDWYGMSDENGRPEYHWFDGGSDAVAWQENGQWKLSYSIDLGPFVKRDLGEHPSVDDALDRADAVINRAYHFHKLIIPRAEIAPEPAKERAMKALLIPADPTRAVEMIEINGRDDIRQHVGGLPEATRYDYDSLLYVSDTGRIDGQPMNVRATDYIRRDSEAARQGKMPGIDPSYGLYSPVVVVGDGANGLRDVPDRLVERFAPTRDVSLGDKIRDAIRDRNEDGMIRFPWLKDRSKSHESPSFNWTTEKVDGRTVYYRTQGEAVVGKDQGLWMIDFAPDPGVAHHPCRLRTYAFDRPGTPLGRHDNHECRGRTPPKLRGRAQCRKPRQGGRRPHTRGTGLA